MIAPWCHKPGLGLRLYYPHSSLPNERKWPRGVGFSVRFGSSIRLSAVTLPGGLSFPPQTRQVVISEPVARTGRSAVMLV